MIEVGRSNTLQILRETPQGLRLGTDEHNLLLPRRWVPEQLPDDGWLEVFVFTDSEDRLIATIAAFASKFKRQQAVRHHHAARSTATSSIDAAVGGMPDGLREELEALLQLICTARASNDCGTGTKGSLSATANMHVHLAD